MTLPALPDLGVGLIHQPGLEPLLEAGRDLLDVVEIEPQTFWFRTEAGYREREDMLAALERLPQRKLVHGVGFPVGGTTPPEPAVLGPFAGTIRRLDAPWCSEHLSFNRVPGDDAGFSTLFLLPPVQSPAAVRLAAENIRATRQLLPVPFAFETGVNYLRPRPGELSDGAFFAGIARAADCGILLDLHNLWCNERNGRQPVLDVLAELPLDRVWEVHLAGGQELDGYWLDAHSGAVPEELMRLAAEIVPALPNVHAIVFEMVPDQLTSGRVPLPSLVRQLERIRELWEVRGTGHPAARPSGAGRDGPQRDLPSPYDWERALGLAVAGREVPGPLGASLRCDAGVAVIRRVVDQVRAGRLVDALRYTYRLVVLSRGEDRFAALLDSYRRDTAPHLFAADEVAAFAGHLLEHAADVPHLADVIALELAAHRAQATRTEQVVRVGADPLELLTALGQGRLPARTTPATYETTIPPT